MRQMRVANSQPAEDDFEKTVSVPGTCPLVEQGLHNMQFVVDFMIPFILPFAPDASFYSRFVVLIRYVTNINFSCSTCGCGTVSCLIPRDAYMTRHPTKDNLQFA